MRALEERGRPGLALWLLRALLDVAWNAPGERLATSREARRADAAGAYSAGPGGEGRDPVWGGLAHDLRFALRLLARRPALAITLVVTLGLGTGATTALFGIVDAALLRPLPYPDADRIVLVRQEDPEFGAYGFAPPYIADLRERITTVEPAAWRRPLADVWDLSKSRAIVSSN